MIKKVAECKKVTIVMDEHWAYEDWGFFGGFHIDGGMFKQVAVTRMSHKLNVLSIPRMDCPEQHDF